MANERIQIEVSENGSRTVKRNIESIGESARRAAGGVDFLQTALAALTFRSAANIIDSYTKMQNKLATVTKSQAELAAVTQRLYEVAGNTRQRIDTVTDAYFRFNGALEKMGYSQSQVIDLTETISKAFVVAGASADETERAMVQLAQGFSKNKLQTQDLKAAMEQAPYVIQVLAKNLNIAGYSAEQAEFALYALAEQGKLTGKAMYDAFVKARAEIQERFEKTLPTIEQGVLAIQRAFSRWFGEVAKNSGLANALGEGLQNLAKNFSDFAGYVGVAAAALASMAATRLVLSSIAALLGLLTAPLLLIPALVGGATAAILTFGDGIKLAGAESLSLKGLAVQAFTEAKDAASNWVSAMIKKFPEVGKIMKSVFGTDFELTLKGALTYGYGVAQHLTVYFTAAAETLIENWKLIPAALLDIFISATNYVTGQVAKMLNYVYNSISDFLSKTIGADIGKIAAGGLDIPLTGAADRMTHVLTTKVQEGLKDLVPAGDVVDGLYQRAAESERKLTEQQVQDAAKVAAARKALDEKRPDRTPEVSGAAQKILDDLRKEAEALKLTNDQYIIRHQMIAYEKQLGDDLNNTVRTQLEQQLQTNLNLQRRKELMEQIIQPQTQYKEGMAALNQLFADGRINVEQYNQQLDQMTLKYLEALPAATTFTDGLSRQLQIMTINAKNDMGTLGTEVGKIFGPGGTLAQGIADSVAQAIVFGKSWKDSIRQVAQSILSQLISAIVKVGVNMLLTSALGQTINATATATTAASGATIAASMAPAAAMTSLATGGMNATGLLGIIPAIMSMFTGFIGGFKDGGYTGSVGTNQVAGVVHGQEFVMNANATRKHRATLEALNAGRDLGTQVVAPAAPPVSVNITNEIPDAAFEARALTENEVEIIARRVVHRDAPEVFANDLRSANSRSSKAMSSNIAAPRRR